MNELFMGIIENIIEKIENNEFKSYFYQDKNGVKNFHIIDEKEKIDFEAKFSNNSYAIKDNINKIAYISVKKYLDEETTARKILIDFYNEQYYYSFLEKDSYTKLVKLIRRFDDEYLICDDINAINKSNEELIKYANEKLDKYGVEENAISRRNESTFKIPNDTYSENILSSNSNNQNNQSKGSSKDNQGDILDFGEELDLDKYDESDFYVDTYNDEEYEEDDEFDYDEDYDGDDYNDNDYDEDEYLTEEDIESSEELFGELVPDYIFGEEELNKEELQSVTEVFEERTISEYEEYIEDEAKTSKRKNYGKQDKDVELLLDFYSSIKIIINGKEKTGREKILIARDCDVLIEDKFFSSMMINEYANNLELVLAARNKHLGETRENER